jgi:4-amino-4-deoxy-L-arabinose transferase-like glycosyltransferase
VVLLAALLPRVLGLGRFITFDEANFWLKRSEQFLQAIASGDLGATAISVHPGVTTMWLGSAGILLHRALLTAGWVIGDSFAARLAIMQLPAALVNAGAVLAGYRLLRRLMPVPAALLAALLWALDPFVIGYSRLLHTDALAGTFITLSLLAACVYWQHGRRARWLILSGLCGGLAVLSKSPSAALLPWVAALALCTWSQEPRTKNQAPAGGSRLLALGARTAPLLIWCGVMAATVVVLWPATFAAPGRVLDQLRLGVTAEGAQPHQMGNFFLGRVYADEDPGLRFYPVALALRATPWTLLGLLLLPIGLRRLAGATRRDLAALAGFVVLFTLTMDLFPKKFDRYLEPVFPAIDILAAAGLWAIADWKLQISDWAQRKSAIYKMQSAIRSGVASIVVLAAIANVAHWHPYEIGAFNQALGGARAGIGTFVVGWGEGLEQAADWLNQQPDITGVTVAALRTEPLQAYLRDGAQAVAPPASGFAAQSGYAVIYLPDVSDGRALPPFDQLFGKVAPAHTVTINGQPYAWIYQLAPPVPNPVEAQFGSDIELRGFALAEPVQPGRPLALAIYWATGARPPANSAYFAHLIGPDGTRYAQADPVLPVEQWGPQRAFTTPLALPLPPDLAPGRYQLEIGVYDRATGQRLPLRNPAAEGPATDGAGALKLMEFDIQG